MGDGDDGTKQWDAYERDMADGVGALAVANGRVDAVGDAVVRNGVDRPIVNRQKAPNQAMKAKHQWRDQ